MKKIDIKNRTCYYFDYIIRFKDKGIDFSDVLLNKKLYIKKIRKYFNL